MLATGNAIIAARPNLPAKWLGSAGWGRAEQTVTENHCTAMEHLGREASSTTPRWVSVAVSGRCYSRAAMEAMAWTAIGLLGAAVLGSFGGFFYLGTRIDALGARLDSRMDALGDRIDAQSDRIDAQGARIDAQYASIQGQGRDLTAAIQAQGRDLTAAIQAQGARVDAQDATIQSQGHDLMSAVQAQGRDLAAAIQAQGVELGSRIDALAARMDDHLGRHAG